MTKKNRASRRAAKLFLTTLIFGAIICRNVFMPYMLATEQLPWTNSRSVARAVRYISALIGFDMQYYMFAVVARKDIQVEVTAKDRFGRVVSVPTGLEDQQDIWELWFGSHKRAKTYYNLRNSFWDFRESYLDFVCRRFRTSEGEFPVRTQIVYRATLIEPRREAKEYGGAHVRRSEVLNQEELKCARNRF